MHSSLDSLIQQFSKEKKPVICFLIIIISVLKTEAPITKHYSTVSNWTELNNNCYYNIIEILSVLAGASTKNPVEGGQIIFIKVLYVPMNRREGAVKVARVEAEFSSAVRRSPWQPSHSPHP